MKILIIGGFGFMGTNIKQVLLNSDIPFQIHIYSRQNGLNLLDINSIIDVLKNISPDVIINCAAHVGSMKYVSENGVAVCSDNIQMYLNLFNAISQIKPNSILINPISNCSYPGNSQIQTESEWWNGRIHSSVEAYGLPKKVGFVLSELYNKQFGIKTINLIIPNAYGLYDSTDINRTHALSGIIIRMIQNINSPEFVIWGTGNPIREWIYMEDVAQLIKSILITNNYDLPSYLNIAQNNGISILDSVKLIATKLNFNGSIVNDLTKSDGDPVKVLDDTIFRMYFPDFSFTSLNDGLDKTIEYYKQNLAK